MRLSRKFLLCAAALTVIGAAGCGQKPSASPDATAQPSTSVQVSVQPSVSPKNAAPSAQAEKQLSVKLYFGDPDMTKLVEKTASIHYTKDGEQYLAAMNALKTGPSSDALSLCPGLEFRSAKLTEGKLTVDVSVPAEAQLGSDGESMLLDALKKTAFQFTEVGSLDILVDGKAAESLMGHLELQHPFKRTSK